MAMEHLTVPPPKDNSGKETLAWLKRGALSNYCWVSVNIHSNEISIMTKPTMESPARDTMFIKGINRYSEAGMVIMGWIKRWYDHDETERFRNVWRKKEE